MPRKEGNNPSRDPRHHALMHSAAKGSGLSARLRRKKRENGVHRKSARLKAERG